MVIDRIEHVALGVIRSDGSDRQVVGPDLETCQFLIFVVSMTSDRATVTRIVQSPPTMSRRFRLRLVGDRLPGLHRPASLVEIEGEYVDGRERARHQSVPSFCRGELLCQIVSVVLPLLWEAETTLGDRSVLQAR